MTKNRIAHKTALSMAAALAVSATAFGQEAVYNNTGNYLGQRTSLGNAEFGDQIRLSPSGVQRTLVNLDIAYFIGGTTPATGVVNIYNMGQTEPGSLIFSSGEFTLNSGFNHVVAEGLSVDLPNDFVWTLKFSGLAEGADAGLLFYNPPTSSFPSLGTSADAFWQKIGDTWTYKDTPGIVDNFGARFVTVPEPSTWALLLGGLGMLGFRAFRRK